MSNTTAKQERIIELENIISQAQAELKTLKSEDTNKNNTIICSLSTKHFTTYMFKSDLGEINSKIWYDYWNYGGYGLPNYFNNGTVYGGDISQNNTGTNMSIYARNRDNNYRNLVTVGNQSKTATSDTCYVFRPMFKNI